MNFFGYPMPQFQRRFILLLSFLLFFPASHGYCETVDRVLAMVNNDVITLSEVNEEAADAYRSLAKSMSGQELVKAMNEARESALDMLIDQKLILQKAQKDHVTASEEEIDSALQKLKKQSAGGDGGANMFSNVDISGYSDETLKRRLKIEIIQGKLVSYDVRAKVVVTDEMVREYYRKNYAAEEEHGKYYLLQIGFTWDKNLDDAEAIAEARLKKKQEAERIRKQAEDDEDFKELAKKFSDLPSASDGGDIGAFSLDDMSASMQHAIKDLKPGEISEVIETDDGFQFFKLLSEDEKKKETGDDQFDSVKDQIRNKLFQEKLKETYLDWVQNIKEKAYIQKF